MRLEDRTAIVTGAGSGIGRAAACLFAQEGARVVVVDIDADAGARTQGEIEAAGGEAIAVTSDVTRAADVQRMAEETIGHFGRIDILYNHVGINRPGSVTELDEADWDAVLTANLKSVYLGSLLSKLRLQRMSPRRYGGVGTGHGSTPPPTGGSPVSAFCSMFSQLLKLFPRTEFQALVKRTHAERHARGFTCWGQFVAMLFCQLGRAHSLREICGGLRSSEGKLKHLGITAPSRSTLAYANEHRPWQLYRAVFEALLLRCQPLAKGRKKFRFKNKLVSLDSTVIDLCASLFDWAQFRRTKGAVKLHCLLDHDGYLPSVVVITEGKRPDVRVARTLRFAPGTIVVMDRGYTDYAWFGQLTAQGVWFVTRLKDAAVSEAVEERRIPLQGRVERDQVIRLTGVGAAEKCPHALRRIEVYDPDKDETLVFLTNHLAFGATTIAAIYQDRWQIELFFKALKQNLKIKTFVGTSANALKVQVWTALIAMLVLKYLQLKARFAWSLSNLVALLRMNLFTHRDLWTWLDRPFEGPPAVLVTVQGELALA